MAQAWILDAVIWSLAGITLFSMARVAIGPDPEDRLIGLNLASSQVLAILVLVAVKLDLAIYLDVALVYAILGFLGILALAGIFRRDGDAS